MVPDTYESELQFSAHDGQFFNGENVVTIQDLFDTTEDVAITKALDSAGNTLTVSEGKIQGVTYSKDKANAGWLEDSITLYTEDRAVTVNVKVAELIIDETSDFDYFTIKGAWDKGTTRNNAYTFTEGEFYWDGYYVLAKNIDAKDYSHVVLQGEGSYTGGLGGYEASRLDHLYNEGIKNMGVPTNGFMGVFDGQGYAISNLTTTADGLLGMIVGGKIQNLAMINCNASNGYAPLARVACYSAKMENLFIQTPARETALSAGAPIVGSMSATVYAVKNVVVIDNTTANNTNSYTWNIGFGSWSSDAFRSSTQSPTFGASNTNTRALDNVIILSTRAVTCSAPVGTAVNNYVAKMDAEYLDGVQQIYDTTGEVVAGENQAIVDYSVVSGMRRYSSQQALTDDATNIQTQLIALTSTGYFTVTDGVISWVKAN